MRERHQQRRYVAAWRFVSVCVCVRETPCRGNCATPWKASSCVFQCGVMASLGSNACTSQAVDHAQALSLRLHVLRRGGDERGACWLAVCGHPRLQREYRRDAVSGNSWWTTSGSCNTGGTTGHVDEGERGSAESQLAVLFARPSCFLVCLFLPASSMRIVAVHMGLSRPRLGCPCRPTGLLLAHWPVSVWPATFSRARPLAGVWG